MANTVSGASVCPTIWLRGAGRPDQRFRFARGGKAQAAVEDLVNDARTARIEYRRVDIGLAADRGSVAQFGGHLFDHLGDLALQGALPGRAG